jgi:hypothetical protein
MSACRCWAIMWTARAIAWASAIAAGSASEQVVGVLGHAPSVILVAAAQHIALAAAICILSVTGVLQAGRGLAPSPGAPRNAGTLLSPDGCCTHRQLLLAAALAGQHQMPLFDAVPGNAGMRMDSASTHLAEAQAVAFTLQSTGHHRTAQPSILAVGRLACRRECWLG